MAKDSLSALLDGQCSPAELDRILDEMQRAPELGQAWSRLCLARDAAEGVRVRRGQACICSDVMGKLEQRPFSVADRVVPLVRRRAGQLWKPVAGLAMAASVAAVAVTLTVALNGSGSGPASLPGVSSPQVAGEVSLPVVPRRPRYLQAVSAAESYPVDGNRAAFDDELRNYLIEHSNTLAGRGMGATLPYARFAAHSVGDPAMTTISTELREDRP